MTVLHSCLLVLSVLSALPLGKDHRPIAIALGGSCLAALGSWLALELELERGVSWTISIAIALAPAALVAWATWGLAGRSWWLLAAAITAAAETCCLGAWAELGIQQEHLGRALALAWGVSAWIGVLALRPLASRAARDGLPRKHTRTVLLALLTSLVPEGLGWLAWGRKIEGGYPLASVVTCMSLLVVCAVQLHELRHTWKSRPTSSSLPPSGPRSVGPFGA